MMDKLLKYVSVGSYTTELFIRKDILRWDTLLNTTSLKYSSTIKIMAKIG